MDSSLTEALGFIRFSSILNITTIMERINVDVARLGVLLDQRYTDTCQRGTWSDWAIHWALCLAFFLWAERNSILLQTHLVLAAIFPIYVGSHASLRRPPSAAKPKEKKDIDEGDDEIVVEPTVEGLTPSDAIMFPVLAGITLGGLYLLIKWLKDPALLNKILGWYFSALGVFGVGRLAADALKVGTSFVFPEVWSSNYRSYYPDPSKSLQVTGWIRKDRTPVPAKIIDELTNPFPGRLLSVMRFPDFMTRSFWGFRSLLKSHWIFRGYLHNVFSVTSRVQIQDITGFMFGLAAVTLYNTWDKIWFLTNLIGFGFCYGTLQLVSPTTFWTGSLVLGGLFIYDITMVFYTPLMVTVATSLDVPIKLVFPGAAGQRGSMLGLGDVVLPGIMMALALRFDLYLHYLRKQTRSGTSIKKADYFDATGNWGERFWTDAASVAHNETIADGARFKKVYFYASLIGYITGMFTTLAVLKTYNHAQPALLYLVPGVLIALWGTALVRGEIFVMWEYTEDTSPRDESSTQEETIEASKDLPEAESAEIAHQKENDLSSFYSSSEDESESKVREVVPLDIPKVTINGTEAKEKEKVKVAPHAPHVFLFSLSAPKRKIGT